MQQTENNKAYDYDDIAEHIFKSIYGVIAEQIVARTRVHSGNLVDIGCGGGHLGFAVLQRTQLEGYFIDIQPAAAAVCEERATALGLAHRAHITTGDVHALPYPDGFAHLIISRGSMGFWGEYEIAFAEIGRVLAHGGRTYIGSGLGNRETRLAINEKMRARDPDWPHSIRRRQTHLPTEELRRIIAQTAPTCELTVIESEDEGRWFLLSKS